MLPKQMSFVQVSSVLYEPPHPSKGVNFFNFKTLQGRPGTELPEKTSSKRDQPPVEPSLFPSFFNSDVINEDIKNFQDQLKGEPSPERIHPKFPKNDNSIDFGESVEVGFRLSFDLP